MNSQDFIALRARIHNVSGNLFYVHSLEKRSILCAFDDILKQIIWPAWKSTWIASVYTEQFYNYCVSCLIV